jgi:hypothetical protein
LNENPGHSVVFFPCSSRYQLLHPDAQTGLRGKVVSGRAAFGLWIERLSSFYEQKTGMRVMSRALFEIEFL